MAGTGRDAAPAVPVKIPIGIDDFREMRREGYTFIDKSFFVRDVLDNASKVLLLPRPRRFGKTLNLSMLRWFFDRSGEDARGLFDGLLLAREGEHVWRHANRYPVIAMTFKEARSKTVGRRRLTGSIPAPMSSCVTSSSATPRRWRIRSKRCSPGG